MGKLAGRELGAKKPRAAAKNQSDAAGVAQPVKQRHSKPRAAGSSPAARSNADWDVSAPPGRTVGERWKAWSSRPQDAIVDLCAFVVDGGHLPGYVKTRGIGYTTTRNWIDADPQRQAMYARAREDRADKLADEIVAISDEECTTVTRSEDGESQEVKFDAAAVARNRLRVDARKWVASKLKPRIYGEKLDVTQQVTVRDLSDDALTARLAALGVNVCLSLPAEKSQIAGDGVEKSGLEQPL